MTTIRAQSGHTLHIEAVNELPEACKYRQSYTNCYIVRNFTKDGRVMLYMGKGNPRASRQICVWYPNGEMWGSYGTSFQNAIDGAQKDGWMYAT